MRALFRDKLRWLLIFWLFIISATAYLDRVNISIAGPAIQQEFGLTNAQLGTVFSAFVLGYALFQVPGGRFVDRVGPRLTLLLATLWWAVFTALTAAVPVGIAGAVFVLLGVRFALGLGEAVVYPASNRLVSKWIPSAERGRANGLIFAGVGVGAGVSAPLVIYIINNLGWQASFWISAALGLFIGVIWYWMARDVPHGHPWVSEKEAEVIETGLPAAARAPSAPPVTWRQILSSRSVAAMSLSYFTYGYVAYIYFTWFFIYLRVVRGVDLKSSAILGALPGIAMAICSPLGGWISDRLTARFGRRTGRCILASIAMGASAVFVAFGPLAANSYTAVLLLAGGAGALYLSQSSFWSVSADISGPSAGVVSGFMNMANQIGGAITASLTPILADHFGWATAFLITAGICACGAVAWLFVDPAKPVTES